MRASKGDDMRSAELRVTGSELRVTRNSQLGTRNFAPVEGEVFVGEADGLRSTGGQVLGTRDRLPEAAEEAPGQRVRAGVIEIVPGFPAPDRSDCPPSLSVCTDDSSRGGD